MKKLFVLLAFVGAFAINSATAQTTASTDEAKEMTAADKAAAADETIVVKTCEHSGTKTYYKKSTEESTGKVSLTKVTYNAEARSFSSMPAKGHAGCADSKAKASCASKASASTAAAKSGCCSSKAKSSCGDAKGKVKT